MVTAGILPFRENSHGKAGNRTRNIMISSQKLWPLDHEAGLHKEYKKKDLQLQLMVEISKVMLYNLYKKNLKTAYFQM
jgi:hypothetical protein